MCAFSFMHAPYQLAFLLIFAIKLNSRNTKSYKTDRALKEQIFRK